LLSLATSPARGKHFLHSGNSYGIDYNSMQEGKNDSQPTYAAVTARSYHPGLVNAVRMDGSVKPINDSIQLEAWRALSTRDGSELPQ